MAHPSIETLVKELGDRIKEEEQSADALLSLRAALTAALKFVAPGADEADANTSGLLDCPLTATCRSALTEIFHRFASTAVMSARDLRAYVVACGVSATPDSIGAILSEYGVDTSGGHVLTLDNFCKFYHFACLNRPRVVWKELNLHGYESVVHQITQFKG